MSEPSWPVFTTDDRGSSCSETSLHLYGDMALRARFTQCASPRLLLPVPRVWEVLVLGYVSRAQKLRTARAGVAGNCLPRRSATRQPT